MPRKGPIKERWDGYMQQNMPQYQQPRQPMIRNDNMKLAAIVLFAVGFGFHIFGLIPFIGLFFTLIGFACYVAGFVCLCMI
jgi:hypothetical protein